MREIAHTTPTVQPDRLTVTLTAGELAELIRAELEHVQTTPPAEILDRRGAAQLLGVSVAQLDRLTRAGKIPSGRIGDSPRYVRADLIAAVRGGR